MTRFANLRLVLKASIVLALSSSAIAGECSNHNKGAKKQDCVSKDELTQHGVDYCESHWNITNGGWSNFYDSSGKVANIGTVGLFTSKASCKAAYAEIVGGCYNAWDGGTWAAYGTLLHINFCKWGSDAESKDEL
ncbi:hypothetical protein ACHAQJ_005353 [Trichoderma viride]